LAVFVLTILLKYRLYQPRGEGAILNVVIVSVLRQAHGCVLGLSRAASSGASLAAAIRFSFDLFHDHLALQGVWLEPLILSRWLLISSSLLLVSLFLLPLASYFRLLIQAIEIQ
jgi:hypothetical protein